MPKSKMSKLLRSLLPRSASPCVYDAGLDDCENICEFLDDAHKVAGAGDGAGIIRAEQVCGRAQDEAWCHGQAGGPARTCPSPCDL